MKTKNEAYFSIQKEILDGKEQKSRIIRVFVVIVLDFLIISIWGGKLFNILCDSLSQYMRFNTASILVATICTFSFGITLILAFVLPLFSTKRVSETEIIEKAREKFQCATIDAKKIKELEEIIQ